MTNRNGSLALSALVVLIFIGTGTQQASAQQGFVVEYRLPSWKTLHFEDGAKANLHYKTVKDLGCEAKQEAHGGHIDVSYRCANWRRITLPSDASAHNWENWLRASGFETKHEH